MAVSKEDKKHGYQIEIKKELLRLSGYTQSDLYVTEFVGIHH